MIFTRASSGVIHDGVAYTVGMKVAANAGSDYAGLYGTIAEIRTGEDQETENEVPDIMCCFDPPVLPQEVAQLEKRFSDLCRQSKTLEEIALDRVRMSPDEIRILPLSDHSATLYAVISDWENGDSHGYDESLFTDYDAAKQQFNSDLEEELLNGASVQWRERDDFTEEEGKNFYSCGIENTLTYNRFILRIEQRLLPISPVFAAEAAKRHLTNTQLNDLLSLLPKDTALPVGTGDLERLADRIESSLCKSESCSDAYWEALSQLAEEWKHAATVSDC